MRSIPNHREIACLAAFALAIVLVAACTGPAEPVRSAAPTGSLTPAASGAASASAPSPSVASLAASPAASASASLSVSALVSPSVSASASVSASPGAGGYTRGGYATVASSEPAALGAQAYVVTASSGAVGPYLTGADGHTLYTFRADGPNTSTCTDSCAQTWPPFVVSAADSFKAGSGVTGALTTFLRPGGVMQVAYREAPLYYFNRDAKAGDTNGQGIGDTWFVAAP